MIKSMITHPEDDTPFTLDKKLGHGFALYTDGDGAYAVGKNGSMVELTFMNKSGKPLKTYTFDHLRDEPTNEHYFEISNDTFTCSFRRRDMSLELDDNQTLRHEFPGGDIKRSGMRVAG